MTPPRYQSITRDALRLLTSDDGGALIRLIAGDIAGFSGPGVTHTPITYAHATLAPGAQLSVPWNPAFSALAYVLTGRGTAGAEGRPVESGQLVVFGPGDHLVVAAADRQAEPLDVLLLGGLPIRRADRPLRAVRDEHPRRRSSRPSRTTRPAGSASSPPTSSRPELRVSRSCGHLDQVGDVDAEQRRVRGLSAHRWSVGVVRSRRRTRPPAAQRGRRSCRRNQGGPIEVARCCARAGPNAN